MTPKVASVKIIDRFEIPYYQYLDEKSELAADAPAFAKDPDVLLSLYRNMFFTRALDAKAIALQRTGKLGTYPSTRGQEAIFVGLGFAMEKKDLFVPYYRDLGTLIMRGVKPWQVFLYWGGDERGNVFESDDLPFSVPVGSQPLHATGVAFATKYRKQKRAVLVTCGDGATSQGDFYEALNVAGAWGLPVVFVVCNNQWAISVSRTAQSAAQTLAQKAIAAGIPGEQVDGNDIIAVVERTQKALQAARENNQPCLLEMVCYRQHDHTTADDASRYEIKTVRETEWQKEPLNRLREYLIKEKILNAAEDKKIEEASAQEVEEAVNIYLNQPPQAIHSMMDYLYETLPAIYQDQYAAILNQEEQARG